MNDTHTIDLTNCETEPIRYTAAIQPHGALLVIDVLTRVITAASESCQTLLGLSPDALLGQSIGKVLGQEVEVAWQAGLGDNTPPWIPLLLNGLPFSTRIMLNGAGQMLVEIESSAQHDVVNMVYRYRRGLEALRCLGDVTVVAQAAAELFRDLTGFDQVMIYRFDAQWNCVVIAEATADGVEPYLGLHFPASDIPSQARELFKLCRVRLIPDVCYTPSALLAKGDARAIDLGRSGLRSVSSIHIEYLQNMGARATLVAPLFVEDRLWGVVSCQQKHEPKYFNPAERDVLGWLCDDIAALIESRLIGERCEREHNLALRRSKLIEAVRAREFKEFICPENNADVLGVVGADGFALLVDDAIQVTGSTPEIARIMALYQRRRELKPHTTLFATHALCRDMGIETAHDGIAGVLFVSGAIKSVGRLNANFGSYCAPYIKKSRRQT